MTDKELVMLLERVRIARGVDDDGSNPDWRMRRRELDADIWATGWEVVRDAYTGLPYYEPVCGESWQLVPQATLSVDAAMELLGRSFPGWGAEVTKVAETGEGLSRVFPGDARNGDETAFGYGDNPALSLVVAILCARRAASARGRE